jgi:aminopeptidase N
MTKTVTRLFQQFQPTHYELELVPERENKVFHGTVTITGRKAGRPSQRLTLHQNGLKVISATISHTDKKGTTHEIPVDRINMQNSFHEFRLHATKMLYPGQYQITLEFSGKIQEGMHGIYACNYELDGKKQQLIATQFESHHAREAFPCIDEPEAKATFDFSLVSPVGEAAIANTLPVSQTEKDGMLHTRFATTPKMSTYLLAFVFGDMQHKSATTKDGVEVRVWATKAQPSESLDFALEVGRRGIEFFNDYYGVPYPLEKCDHVALPDFSSAAMENWGLITYREPYLLIDPASSSQSSRETCAIVVLHELSHQWFGNLVTMKWWDDLWLNESFANVMEYVSTDALFPEWEVWNSFVAQEGLSAFRRDAIAGVQAVKTEVHHPDEISTLFDPSIVYAKGGRLLNMLKHYIGEDDFRKGLKVYFTKHAYGNTTGDDLWAALSTASGKDVAGFMNPWLHRSGFPVMRVEQDGTKLALHQKHFLLDPAKANAHRHWPVPLLSDTTGVPQTLEHASLSVTLPAGDYVQLNRGAIGHYLLHYINPAHLQSLAQLASAQKLGVPDRLMLLSDSTMLARAGDQSFAEALTLLEHYTTEQTEPVWDIMALVIADARRFIDADPKLEDSIKALIRQLITPQFKRLGWEDQPDEPSQDTKLRATIIGLGVYAEHPDILAHALELFTAYQSDPTSVPPELRSIVFGAAVRNHAPNAFEYLLGLEEKTQQADLKQDMMAALTLAKEPDEIKTLLSRLKDPQKVRQHDVDHWLASLLRSRFGRPQAWPWLRENWGWIEQTFAADKSYDYFPRYAASAFNTRELLQEYKTFFGPKKTQPALSRNIVMGIEELETRVEWVERDLPSVQHYFKTHPQQS